ncbi:MAG: ABC transporter ATP-binding protein/permease [Oscillospiraceae bacterium]|nr:ABC transporter ATP-binding protein/permease [Oscillospiraceae bacterium]
MMIDKRLLALVPEAKRFAVKKVLSSWISLLAGIVLWFSVADLLEMTMVGAMKNGGWLFALSALCIAARFMLTRLSASLTHRATACVKTRLREEIYEKLRRLGPGYTDAFPTAEVVQLAGEGVEQLESYFGSYLPQFFYAMLAPLTLLAVFLPLSPLTAVVLFLCVPLIPMAIMAVQKVARRLLGKYWDAYANLGDSFLENLQGLTTLKVYGTDAARHQKMNEEAEHFRKVTMKVLTMQLNSVTIMDLVAYGGTALGSILGARAFALGQVSFGGAAAMILLASEFFLSMRALGSYFHTAMNGVAASERMFRLLDLPEPEQGPHTARAGDIALRCLSYSYGGGKRALENVTLTASQGAFVSICGESGCGKSTLAAVLSGLRTGYEGECVIGGVELRDASPESLRKLVTVVSANSYLFAGTVRETLREAAPEAPDAALLEVLHRVNLLDFVMEQGGLDMELSERAANLSGGQRQRLALARALLKDSPIYIFDEATSNIDAESEGAIMEAVYGLKGRHTVLLISHRLANVVGSDQIVFLSHGRLLEWGTHEELMQKNGGYAAMFSAQQALENMGKERRAKCGETA